MNRFIRIAFLALAVVVLSLALLGLWVYTARSAPAPAPAAAQALKPAPEQAAAPNPPVYQYKILAWNDLGMHCYNRRFQDLAVLPPYNTLWAQVIRVGDPPVIVTTGITVTYVFTDNTYSVGKSDFWTYAFQLFGVHLADNIGLEGNGLAGPMKAESDHFIAKGIPLTGVELARTVTVAPVSTEMHCDTCHDDYGRASPDIATGRVETNILTFHDQEQGTHLMSERPVLCAKCHSSNALGTAGEPGVPSLSNAMHNKHTEVIPNSLAGCYDCHPGPNTRCLRDTMSQKGMTCVNCHGGMASVAQNPNPWLNEPRCDNAACHGSNYAQNQPLYRFSTGHGGMYCEGCHDSTHAIAPSTQPNDAIKFMALQNRPGPLVKCTTCHASAPTAPGPHGIGAAIRSIYLPMIAR